MLLAEPQHLAGGQPPSACSAGKRAAKRLDQMRVKPLRSRGGRIARSPQANWGLEIWIGRESLFSGRGTRGSGRRRPCARGGTGAVRPPGETRTHRRATPCGLAQQESRPSRCVASEARGRGGCQQQYPLYRCARPGFRPCLSCGKSAFARSSHGRRCWLVWPGISSAHRISTKARRPKNDQIN